MRLSANQVFNAIDNSIERFAERMATELENSYEAKYNSTVGRIAASIRQAGKSRQTLRYEERITTKQHATALQAKEGR